MSDPPCRLTASYRKACSLVAHYGDGCLMGTTMSLLSGLMSGFEVRSSLMASTMTPATAPP